MNIITTDIDCSKELTEQVRKAFDEATPLCITGGGTKTIEGRTVEGRPLSVLEHHGIIEYAPSELVITARAGTPLVDIETRLAESNQMLAFEPPHLDAHTNGKATIGGTIVCGLSGPRRPYAGAARDVVLGTRIINGRGEILSFGGQVMKNVAGYDVSRLMVGAQGTLGVLLDVSLKVLPVPECEHTLCLEMNEEDAIRMMNQLAGKPVPLSAACYLPSDNGGDSHASKLGQLYLRLSGVESSLKAAAKKIGGDHIKQSQQFWQDLRERKLDFFGLPDSEQTNRLWRLSLPPASPVLSLPGSCLIDWGGAQRWLKTQAAVEDVRSVATQVGGHATLYHSQGAQFSPLTSGLRVLHQRLKANFDPKNILNPGRLYEGL